MILAGNIRMKRRLMELIMWERKLVGVIQMKALIQSIRGYIGTKTIHILMNIYWMRGMRRLIVNPFPIEMEDLVITSGNYIWKWKKIGPLEVAPTSKVKSGITTIMEAPRKTKKEGITVTVIQVGVKMLVKEKERSPVPNGKMRTIISWNTILIIRIRLILKGKGKTKIIVIPDILDTPLGMKRTPSARS